jgi:hypothetical protein
MSRLLAESPVILGSAASSGRRWLRRLVAGFSPQRPGFDPGSVHVRFVVDKVALGQVFFSELSVFPCQFHSTGAPLIVKLGKKTAHLHHRGCTRNLKAAVLP